MKVGVVGGVVVMLSGLARDGRDRGGERSADSRGGVCGCDHLRWRWSGGRNGEGGTGQRASIYTGGMIDEVGT